VCRCNPRTLTLTLTLTRTLTLNPAQAWGSPTASGGRSQCRHHHADELIAGLTWGMVAWGMGMCWGALAPCTEWRARGVHARAHARRAACPCVQLLPPPLPHPTDKWDLRLLRLQQPLSTVAESAARPRPRCPPPHTPGHARVGGGGTLSAVPAHHTCGLVPQAHPGPSGWPPLYIHTRATYVPHQGTSGAQREREGLGRQC